MKQLIKHILREETIKKFDKSNINRGKLSSAIEKVATDYIGEENICDLIAILQDKTYVLLVLFNGSSKWDLNTKIENYIKTIIPGIRFFSLINDTECGNNRK